jgi:periplasmic protein TonB
MPPSDLETRLGADTTVINSAITSKKQPEPEYKLTQFEEPFFLISLIRQIGQKLSEPKLTVPREYYRGEARLPITEMQAWYHELPEQIRFALHRPDDAVGAFNFDQERKRLLVGAAFIFAGAAAGWFLRHGAGLFVGAIAGVVVGRGVATVAFKKRSYPPDFWQDYKQQPASWINSLLVHALIVVAMVMPFFISRMLRPVKAQTKATTIVDISPYLGELPASPKKAGGGGGGGDRSPTPASRGKIPKFAREQFTPAMAKLPNLTPKLPMTPTLLGPPELKLPEMAMNAPFGDPKGVPGPPSNGPGTGGGIGTGTGTGIGSGDGGGLGPGSGGGTGGGVFSVGGDVSAPIPIYKPEPPYSEEARKAKYQGTVVLYIVVDSQGNVNDARVVKPLGLGLDEKAVDTVRTWKFTPAKRAGVPVTVRVMVEVSFRLF